METELVDWTLDRSSQMYVNRWDKKVKLPVAVPRVSVLRPRTPEEINSVLNDVAIHLRRRKKI